MAELYRARLAHDFNFNVLLQGAAPQTIGGNGEIR